MTDMPSSKQTCKRSSVPVNKVYIFSHTQRANTMPHTPYMVTMMLTVRSTHPAVALFSIESGSGASAITCALSCYDLSDVPSHTASSYAWGCNTMHWNVRLSDQQSGVRENSCLFLVPHAA